MLANNHFVKFVFFGFALLASASAYSQDELRSTFFKEVDAAKALADERDAKLLAPRSYERGMKDFREHM